MNNQQIEALFVPYLVKEPDVGDTDYKYKCAVLNEFGIDNEHTTASMYKYERLLNEINQMKIDFAKYGNYGGNGTTRQWWRDLKYQEELSKMCNSDQILTLEEIYYTLKHKMGMIK